MSTDTKTIGIKLTPELLSDVQQHQERMRAENPGMNVTVSDAVRSMIKIAATRGKKR